MRRLDLFSSVERRDFDPRRSYIDFLVEFHREHPDALSFSIYFDFKEALPSLLGRPVNLVEPRAVRNRYFKAVIDTSREPIFEA